MTVQLSEKNGFDLSPTSFEAVVSKLAPSFSEGSFAEVFSKITQKFKIDRYFFCKHTDSFILIDHEGTSHFFILRSKSELEKYAELARAQQVSPELIRRITIGRMIPFWGTFEKFESAKAADWIVHTYSAKKIGEAYFYALIGAKGTAALLAQ